MNYILCNIGNLPNYLEECINTIMSTDKDADIYLISDKDVKIKKVNTLNINNFHDLIIQKDKLIDYYKDTNFSSDKYPLFYSSLLRVHMLNKASEIFNINEFVHFDNDVLIYHPFEKIKNLLTKDSVNITRVSSKDLVFGYSYFPSKELVSKLVDNIDRIIDSNETYSNLYYRGGPLNEMRILGIINKEIEGFFNILPSLPYFSVNNLIFDPSSYGQFLNGLHHRRGNYFLKRRWVSPTQEIGREITSKWIEVEFKNQKPYIIFQNSKYELSNLHIHSKNLKKFLPNNYKKYIQI